MGGATPKWTLSPSFPTCLSLWCVVGAVTLAAAVSLVILNLGAWAGSAHLQELCETEERQGIAAKAGGTQC